MVLIYEAIDFYRIGIVHCTNRYQ